MGGGEDNLTYIFIVGADFGNYAWLRNAKTCDEETTANALPDFFATFVAKCKYVQHFNIGLIAKLSNVLSANHSFTSANNS